VAGLVFSVAEFSLGHTTVDAADVDIALCSVHLVHLVAGGLHLVCQLVSEHRVLGGSHNCAVFSCILNVDSGSYFGD
jgi:hypothetical protein